MHNILLFALVSKNKQSYRVTVTCSYMLLVLLLSNHTQKNNRLARIKRLQNTPTHRCNVSNITYLLLKLVRNPNTYKKKTQKIRTLMLFA